MEYEPHVGDIIQVLWEDASCWYTESCEEDWTDEWPVITWGIIVKLTEKSLFVASEYQAGNPSWRGVTRIPFTYITDAKYLGNLDAPT